MIIRALFTILITLTITACAQTKVPNSLSKYEKSVEFVELIITDKFIKDALQQSFSEYKQENEAAAIRLSDQAIEEINSLLTREMIKNRGVLVAKIATIFTEEFTNAEIVALYSIRNIGALIAAQKKTNQKNTGLYGKLTPAEAKVLSDPKNIKTFATLLPKFNALKTKMENTGKEFSKEIISRIFPKFQEIMDRNELLIGAFLFSPKEIAHV